MGKGKHILALLFILLVSLLAFGAITSFFKTRTVTVNVERKDYFQFDINMALDNVALGPGDSVVVNPSVTSDSTVDMYVFIRVINPMVNGVHLYIYEVDDSWVTVEETEEGDIIYAYASHDSMVLLSPGEETIPLTTRMTMRDISIPEYAYIDDLSYSFQVYAVGTEGISVNPEDAWREVKEHFILN